MTPEVAIYVPSAKSYAKQTYKVESFSARKFNGLHIVRDALERAGIPVAFTDLSRVADFKVVLYSITASCDWLPWLRERASWPAHARPTVIVGGAGVLNIRPFLGAADAYVFGRGESIAPPLVAAALRGERFEHSSVAWTDTFDPERAYRIEQAPPYPYPVEMIAKGEKCETFTEQGQWCRNKCFFCGMTWHRRQSGEEAFVSPGAERKEDEQHEVRLAYILGKPASYWRSILTVGLDGFSARLRFRHNKRISREMFREFLVQFAEHRESAYLRVYNVVGLPSEGQADVDEFLEDVRAADSRARPGTRIFLAVTNTPFKAMPATPAACWPMPRFEAAIRYIDRMSPRLAKQCCFIGKRFSVLHDLRCETFGTAGFDGLVLRATEADARTMKALALAKYEDKPGDVKIATLHKYFDLDRLLGPQTWDGLATRYLEGYRTNEQLARLDAAFARKYGGHQPEAR